MEGIADFLDQPFHTMFFLQFFYEFTSFPACSAVLVRTPENKIIHGRNFDYSWQSYFSKMTAEIDIYRGEKYIASAWFIISGVTVSTGYKKGIYSV